MKLASKAALLRLIAVVISLHYTLALVSQSNVRPLAKFTFNEGSLIDEISGTTIIAKGVRRAGDRFGNKNNAINLLGDRYSYLNLGSGDNLKAREGSVALWIKLDQPVYTGRGDHTNPILIARRNSSDKFSEAFGIYYDYDARRLVTSCARDSIRQTVIMDLDTTLFNRWYHLAITYSDKHLAFYVDGKLVHRSPKNFPTVFVRGDPVLVGIDNNSRNSRYMRGSVDDILFYDVVLDDDQVARLYNARDPNKETIFWRTIAIVAGFAVLAFLLGLLIRVRMVSAHHKERKRLELQNAILETEIRVNRALMNPHFVFNALNTLQNFILKHEYKNANKYLVSFSKLMREVMERSVENSIDLATETDLLKRYLEIEELRFGGNIHYEITISPELDPPLIKIPIMMVQPFVENAIWHGLLQKEGEKKIVISFFAGENHTVICTIEDNGIGLPQTQGGKTEEEKKTRSTGFVRQRLALLNQLHGVKCFLEITNKKNGAGVIVKICLPMLE